MAGGCWCSVGQGRSLCMSVNDIYSQSVSGRSGRQTGISLLCLYGRKVILDRQVCTHSWQWEPGRCASYLGDFTDISSLDFIWAWQGHTALLYQSSSCRAILVWVRFIAPNEVPARGMEAATCSHEVWETTPLCGGAGGWMATHPSATSGCCLVPLSISPYPHASLHLPAPDLRGAPYLPPHTAPVQLWMLVDAEWYLRPFKASARGAMGATKIGPGACRWASCQWAGWELGWEGTRYGQVCPGRAGTARLYHDIQVFPLPVLSLALRTEPDYKHSN